MADPLYLSLWFPQFELASLMPRAVSVMRQFPFSAQRPGVEYVSVQPVAWSESTILERRFRPGVAPEEAAGIASEFLHADYAYIFEAYWDLWTPVALRALSGEQEGEVHYGSWSPQPMLVRFLAFGPEFEEAAYRQDGHIQIDLGLDTPFLHEEIELTPATETHVRNNIQKLVDFTAAIEKNCGISGRQLWSESEGNLAQKLIARLQKVH